MESPGDRGSWGSRLGFILAAAGSAVGLGNIWGFPTRVGQGGGARFRPRLPAVRVACLRAHHDRGVRARARIATRSGGGLQVLPTRLQVVAGGSARRHGGGGNSLVLFSVIAGWTVAYIWFTATGSVGGTSRARSKQFLLVPSSANGTLNIFLTFGFLAVTAASILTGVRSRHRARYESAHAYPFRIVDGRPRRSRHHASRRCGGARILFAARFQQGPGRRRAQRCSRASVFLPQPGHGSHDHVRKLSEQGRRALRRVPCGSSPWILPSRSSPASSSSPRDSLSKDSILVPPAPVLFSTSCPTVFSTLPGGALFGTAFFVLLAMAALTSTISLLEVPVSHFIDEYHWPRKKAVLIIAAGTFLLAIPSALGNGAVSSLSNFSAGLGGNFLGLMAMLWNRLRTSRRRLSHRRVRGLRLENRIGDRRAGGQQHLVSLSPCLGRLDTVRRSSVAIGAIILVTMWPQLFS